jgi:hypothetical protein
LTGEARAVNKITTEMFSARSPLWQAISSTVRV